MNRLTPSRRSLLRTGAAALAGGALAGCLGPLDGGDGPSDSTAAVDAVPAGSRLVVHADAAALLEDDVLRSRLGEFFDGDGMPSVSVESALDVVENEVGLDPRELETVTAFGGYEPDAPAGVTVEAGWSESSIRDAAAGSSEPAADTYGGQTVYEFDDASLGVLSEGAYVAGTRAGVEAAIDVSTGDADPVDGTVRDGFASAPVGPIRFAFETPADLGEGPSGTTDSAIDPEAVASVTHGYGGYVLDGDRRRASLTVATESDDDATLLAEGLRTAREEMQRQLDERTGTDRAVTRPFGELLDSMDVTADGASVRVTTDRGEMLPIVLGAVLGTFTLDLGSSRSAPQIPQVSFGFDYDADVGVLEVTHEGGDHARADGLFLRGDGLTSAEGADMSGPGQWAGTASGTEGGQPAVVAGDSVTVGLEADGVCRVVWTAEDGESSAELAKFSG